MSGNCCKSVGAPPSLNIRGHIFNITNTIPDVKFDFKWIIANTSMEEGDLFEVSALNCDIKVVDSNGEVLKTFQDLESELPRSTENLEDMTGLSHEFQFDDEYLTWPDCSYEKLKLEKITFQFDVSYTMSVIAFEGRWVAKAVLEDIKTGDIHLHKKEGFLV